ncbi:hypothetical protein [Saccharopolyspora shandongensis]|uniref:hypothetical protein n=1 Tax=Saccharopolyspora shandongensis TaxID=418495 RepID=UPI0033D9C945
MLDYAHFGATNADLGLDTMSSGIGGQILGMIGGSVIWVLYAQALAVSTLFYLIIQLIKAINPFMWFFQAVSAVNATFGEGMVCSTDTSGAETCHLGGGALAGLQNWISDWYGLLNSIAWEALVPLFIALTIIGLILFKKMDRGSAIKKLIVRLVFIGVGLPLIGSMYTGVLDKFDDSMMGQQSGPTRVVLSTYVDFEAWAMKDRLGIPDAASIAWDNGQASSDAMMSVRTSALAINKQSHGSTYSDINVGKKVNDAESAWRDGMTGVDRTATDDANAVFTTFGIIGNYIISNEAAASDFESGIKSAITKLDVSQDDKKKWFVDKKGYGDLDKFGEEAGDYPPTNHPVLAVGDGGLTSSNPGGNTTAFTTPGTKSGCGFTVWTDGAPAPCNLSALSMYNYLNTGFGPDSLTMYSSNNATSGFTRENHMAVSQVGTGPAKFMYWHNASTVLGSIALLGFWYAIGMLVGAVKRTFSLVAAIPFATLGAMAAISKVIVYSLALILEVLVTLFIYQFVSEFLISIPDIITGPMSSLMTPDGLLGSAVLGGIVVVILTLISSLLVMGVTFALLRVRKVVLQAMDEVFTKLVDKFLDTNTAPKPDKSGMLPALAAGAGAGAGMAMGNKMASGLGGKIGGGPKIPGGDKSGGKTTSTNAGGLNADPQALTADPQALALEAGGWSGGNGPGGLPPSDGGGPGGSAKALPGGSAPEGIPGFRGGDGDTGGPLQLMSGTGGSSRSDKKTAQNLSNSGGLSKLGYYSGPQAGSGNPQDGQIYFGASGASGTPGSNGSASRGQGKGARFAVGASGSAQLNPDQAGTSGVPSTRSTRAARGSHPQGQLGAGAHPGVGDQGQRKLPPAGGQQQTGAQRPQAHAPAAGSASRPAQPTNGRPQRPQQGVPQAAPAPHPTQSRPQRALTPRPTGGSKSTQAAKPAPGSGPSVQPQSQTPVKPRKMADSVPKRMDGPRSQRKPDESKD